MPVLRCRSALGVARAALAALGVAMLGAVAVPRAQAARLLVGSTRPGAILSYDARTGVFMGTFAVHPRGDTLIPAGMAFGPDGHLYVSSSFTHEILRFNGQTGAFIDVFVPAGRSPLLRSFGITFGPDGNLYVSAFTMTGPSTLAGPASGILRYDGRTGAYLGAFVPPSGGLVGAAGLVFGPDGNLYVANLGGHNVLRYSGRTGAFQGVFVPEGSGGLGSPANLVFGPDGRLYVTNLYTGDVLRYDGRTGAFLDEFVPAGSGGLNGAFGLAFGPDHHLYVSSNGSGDVLRYDGKTGAFMNEFIPAGRGGLDGAQAIAFTPPAAPSSLQASARSDVEIDLSWKDNSDDEAGFEIVRRIGNGPFARIALVPANTTSYADRRGRTLAVVRRASPKTTYTYAVRAFGTAGVSEWSNTASGAMLPAPPLPPTGLSVQMVSATQLKLSWADNSTDETGFEIERRDSKSGWTRIASLPAKSTTYVNTGLKPDSSYTYRVRAVNSGGPSGWSNEMSGDTTQPPAAPSGLFVQAVFATQLNLLWAENSSNVTSFVIQRKSGSGDWEQIAVLGPTSTGFADRGLRSRLTYTYRVRAYNHQAASAWSNEASGTTPAPSRRGR